MLRDSVAALPFTLAYPVSQASQSIKEQRYGAAMNHLLDFLEISTQYVSLLMLVMLKQQGAHTALQAVVSKIDTKRPLSFGDWLNDLFTPLLLSAGELLPAHPLASSLNRCLMQKRRNLLLGGKNEAGVVQIRNEYRGHSTTLSEAIYRDVCYTLEPHILRLLQALQPLTGYRAYAVLPEGEVLQMNGCEGGGRRVASAGEGYAGHYYIEGSEERYDLFPLVFITPQQFVYVFQSLKDESISYISSNENAVTLITDEQNESFDAALQEIVPSFDIAKDLNWDEVRSLLNSDSQGFMERVYKEKKYNNELFVERTQLTASLHEFLASGATLFPLIGEAGQGKTSQLCYWTEKMLEEGEAVLIMSCADFANATLEDKIKDTLGYSRRKDIEKLLDYIHGVAQKSQRRITLFFDAINECFHYKDYEGADESVLALYNDIRRLLVSPRYPCFKTLFTCRTYTWKNLLRRASSQNDALLFNAEGDERYNVRGFSGEEVVKAYRIYQQLYQMATDIQSVDSRVLIRLKDPLVMKIVSTNYLGKELTESSSDYTSVSLFSRMMNDIRLSYAGERQCTIIRGIADYLLDCFLTGNAVTGISVQSLKEAGSDSRHRLYGTSRLVYKNDGISIAFAELLHKPERPILREVKLKESAVATIQFVYERFLEYVLADAFIRKNRAGLAPQEPLPPKVYREAFEKASVNVVFMGCMRNVMLIDYSLTRDFSTLISLSRDGAQEVSITQMIGDVMDVLVRENYEDELFALQELLLDYNIPDSKAVVGRYNEVVRKIETNRADSEVIARHKELSSILSPVIRLRKLASVTLLNGILLTDYYNEKLYRHNALSLLWRLMTDEISEVRNDACMYSYYLSNKRYTHDFTPLDENLSQRIVSAMYAIIKERSLAGNLLSPRLRRRAIIFLETATRLCTLLIIDSLVVNNDRERAGRLVKEVEGIIRYFTLNFVLVKAFMPFLQIIMRKQITFQSVYVNNAMEYQNFWDDSVVAQEAPEGWARNCINEAVSFLPHYQRSLHGMTPVECADEEARFARFVPKILSAYHTGDSFSYFFIERLLVVMGSRRWENISPIFDHAFSSSYRDDEWFDYTQMSLLYVLYQVSVYSHDDNNRLLAIYERECYDWTCRCRGRFKARSSAKANPLGLYKRNVVNWYCVAYCAHGADGAPRTGDERCAPLVYRMIDEAIAAGDKELLFHLIENILELITDFGYIKTALDMVKYILIRFDTPQKVQRIDAVQVDREGIYQEGLTQVIGELFSTAKNYFPEEINSFIKKDIVGLSFPGVASYREEILNYNPSGETLSDLLTHKFGNFLMWAILHEKSVDDFACEAMAAAARVNSCVKWYDNSVHLLFQHMFNIKV